MKTFREWLILRLTQPRLGEIRRFHKEQWMLTTVEFNQEYGGAVPVLKLTYIPQIFAEANRADTT